jgi:hypothetical protein
MTDERMNLKTLIEKPPDADLLLYQRPRRRGDGHHLELPRHNGARASGDVGGLAGGLPADAAVVIVCEIGA